MEKLIYVVMGPTDPVDGRVERLAERVVPAARGIGGERMAIQVPDAAEEIRDRGPARLMGEFDRLAAVFECWVPNLDPRAAIEEALMPAGEALWGYLVTESTMDPCPHSIADGERVPGITQWTINDKPAAVAFDDFYREWAVHSKLSFDLHPHRDSYIRNAIFRKLTADAPTYLGIVLERFPSLDVFCDDALYSGDPAVTQAMFEHTPTFYEAKGAISGGLGEFRFA